MGHTACTEPQCLHKGALYLFTLPQLKTPWTTTHTHDHDTSRITNCQRFLNNFPNLLKEKATEEINNGAVLLAQLYLKNDNGDEEQLHENVDISDLRH